MFVVAGGEVGFGSVVAVESGRIAAERRLRRGGVDDGGGHLGAFEKVDGAEANAAVP